MVTCTAFRVPLVDSPMAAAKKALRFIARRLLRLEREIAELLDDLDKLSQQACPGLRKTYGIGTDGSATLPSSSGKTNRHRLNRGGNRQVNATLHRIALVRLRWHE